MTRKAKTSTTHLNKKKKTKKSVRSEINDKIKELESSKIGYITNIDKTFLYSWDCKTGKIKLLIGQRGDYERFTRK